MEVPPWQILNTSTTLPFCKNCLLYSLWREALRATEATDKNIFQKNFVKNERRQKWNNDTATHSLLAEEAGPAIIKVAPFVLARSADVLNMWRRIQTKIWDSALALTMPKTPRTDNRWNSPRMSATPFPTFGSPSDDDGTSPSPPPMDLPTRVYEAEAVVRLVSFPSSTSSPSPSELLTRRKTVASCTCS